MKRILSVLLVFVLLALALTGCGEKKIEGVTVRLGGLKGPTSIGMVKLLEDDANGESRVDYEFSAYKDGQEIMPLFLKGELDIIAVPSNLAANLYKKTEGAVRILAINTLGVNYILETGNTVNSLQDLKGKTVYAPKTGKGAVPEYTFRHLLSKAGIDPDQDLTVEWLSEPQEVVNKLVEDPTAIAMLPQPFATSAAIQVPTLRVAVDINAEWDKIEGNTQLLTGVVIARRAFVDEHPDAVEAFLEEYAASTTYVNEQVDASAALVEKHGLFKEALAKKAIPNCNITCITGEDMKTAVSAFYDILLAQNPASIGGAKPGDDFYYVGK